MSNNTDNFTHVKDSLEKVSKFASVAAYNLWRDNIRDLFEVYPVKANLEIKLLKMSVTGDVGENVSRASCADATDFWKVMDNEYGKGHNCDEPDNFEELLYPTKEISSMKDYISHYDEYAKRLEKNYFTEDGRIAIFLTPLNRVIADSVRTQNPKTLAEAKVHATSSATMCNGILNPKFKGGKSSKTGETVGTSTKGVECFYCHKMGHTANQCYSRKKNLNSQNYSSRKSFNPRRNQRYERKTKRNPFIDISDDSKKY